MASFAFCRMYNNVKQATPILVLSVLLWSYLLFWLPNVFFFLFFFNTGILIHVQLCLFHHSHFLSLVLNRVNIRWLFHLLYMPIVLPSLENNLAFPSNHNVLLIWMYFCDNAVQFWFIKFGCIVFSWREKEKSA